MKKKGHACIVCVENLLNAEVRYKLHCFFTYTDILDVVLSCLTM